MSATAFQRIRREQENREREAEENKMDKSLEKMTVPELKEYAETNGIDLGDATKKPDILATITGLKDGEPNDLQDGDPQEGDPDGNS